MFHARCAWYRFAPFSPAVVGPGFSDRRSSALISARCLTACCDNGSTSTPRLLPFHPSMSYSNTSPPPDDPYVASSGDMVVPQAPRRRKRSTAISVDPQDIHEGVLPPELARLVPRTAAYGAAAADALPEIPQPVSECSGPGPSGQLRPLDWTKNMMFYSENDKPSDLSAGGMLCLFSLYFFSIPALSHHFPFDSLPTKIGFLWGRNDRVRPDIAPARLPTEPSLYHLFPLFAFVSSFPQTGLRSSCSQVRS